jgi:hypothetical protein
MFQLTENVGNWNSNVPTENVLDLALYVMEPRTVRTAQMKQTVVQVSKLLHAGD